MKMVQFTKDTVGHIHKLENIRTEVFMKAEGGHVHGVVNMRQNVAERPLPYCYYLRMERNYEVID